MALGGLPEPPRARVKKIKSPYFLRGPIERPGLCTVNRCSPPLSLPARLLTLVPLGCSVGLSFLLPSRLCTALCLCLGVAQQHFLICFCFLGRPAIIEFGGPGDSPGPRWPPESTIPGRPRNPETLKNAAEQRQGTGRGRVAPPCLSNKCGIAGCGIFVAPIPSSSRLSNLTV